LQDPSGRSIMRTLLLLKTEWREEQELRLIFDHYPDSTWDVQNTSLNDPRIRVGFDWLQVVTEVEAGPALSKPVEKQLRVALQGK
jgi:hypothetical protein